VLTKPQIKASFTVRHRSQNAMKLAGYGVAQIVVRRLAERQTHVRISVRHPRGALYRAEAIRVSIIVKQILSMLWIQIRVGNADPEPGAWKLTKIKE
jgi:hypothetical protein